MNFYDKIYKKLPLIDCAITSCAFFFQINVLKPWHHVISKQVDELEKEIKMLKPFNGESAVTFSPQNRNEVGDAKMLKKTCK
jgi:hypothetical protein